MEWERYIHEGMGVKVFRVRVVVMAIYLSSNSFDTRRLGADSSVAHACTLHHSWG